MYFTEVKETPKGFRSTKILKLLEDFRDSGIAVARLEDWDYVTAGSGTGTINRAAERFGMSFIKARSHNGEIYLVNELVGKGSEG